MSVNNLPPVNKMTSPVPQLVTGVEQARAEKIATLARLVGLTVGNSVLASVERVEAIDPQAREQLLKQTQDMLLQLQRAPLTPAVKAQIQQLVDQQQLLQSPQLKLAQLLVDGRPLLTYTDRPLQPGQPVPVQLAEGQRLVMMGPDVLQKLLGQAATASPTASAEAKMTSPNPANQSPDLRVNLSRQSSTFQSGPLQTLLDIQQGQKPPLTETPGAQPQVRQLLADALRTLLPQQDQPRELYAALPQLQQLPASQRHELLPQSLQQALKTAADQLRSVDQLANARLLPMVLKNSGVFFEHKLASTLPGNTTQAAQQTANPPEDARIITNRLTTQDLKGALLQLLAQTRQALGQSPVLPDARTGQTTQNATTPLTTIPGLPADLRLPAGFPGLLQLLQQLPQRQAPELSSKQLRTQLLLLLHQHTLISLARVQLQQLHPLNHQQGQADTNQPSQSWVFDIPVRQGHDIHHLELRLEQTWIDDKDADDDSQSNARTRQWSVTLHFDLPDAGAFYAQLQLIDQTVSAKFWAEREATLRETRSRLDNLREQLEAEGLVVQQLQCLDGTPPGHRISLNYSLVDVTT